LIGDERDLSRCIANLIRRSGNLFWHVADLRRRAANVFCGEWIVSRAGLDLPSAHLRLPRSLQRFNEPGLIKHEAYQSAGATADMSFQQVRFAERNEAIGEVLRIPYSGVAIDLQFNCHDFFRLPAFYMDRSNGQCQPNRLGSLYCSER